MQKDNEPSARRWRHVHRQLELGKSSGIIIDQTKIRGKIDEILPVTSVTVDHAQVKPKQMKLSSRKTFSKL